MSGELVSVLSPEILDVEDAGLLYVPKLFADYLGQEKIKEKMEVFVSACKMRREPLDHCLLFGAPGLGKTTLAKIIANELGVGLKITSAPALDKAGDLIAILSGLQERDVLFIDEIHRLPKVLEEILYSAMEGGFVDIIVGQGTGAKCMQLPLNKFTLIGATTKTSLLSGPLQTRFGIIERLDFYLPQELAQIVEKNAAMMNMKISADAALEIGVRGRGTPRIAKRLIRRVRDYAQTKGVQVIDKELASQALDFLGIDKYGLDALDQKIIIALLQNFSRGPVSLDTLAAVTGEDKDTIQDYCEPYLLRTGFLQKTPRGRKIPDALGIDVRDGKIVIVDKLWQQEIDF